MNETQFKNRTKAFGLRIIQLTDAMPRCRSADEALYWIELIIESGMIPHQRLTALKDKCNEILSMLVASIRTIRKNQRSERNNPKSKIQN